MQCCLDSVQQFKKARLQRSDVPRTFLTKERCSENVVDNCSYASSDYKTDSNTSIFPVSFYVIHNMSKRSIKDFFSVIQDENSGSNYEEGKLLDSIAWPCRQTSTQKYCMILLKILKQWRHPHKIFSQKNPVQVNLEKFSNWPYLYILRNISGKNRKINPNITARTP